MHLWSCIFVSPVKCKCQCQSHRIKISDYNYYFFPVPACHHIYALVIEDLWAHVNLYNVYWCMETHYLFFIIINFFPRAYVNSLFYMFGLRLVYVWQLKHWFWIYTLFSLIYIEDAVFCSLNEQTSILMSVERDWTEDSVLP